jgi:hypothetical protein
VAPLVHHLVTQMSNGATSHKQERLVAQEMVVLVAVAVAVAALKINFLKAVDRLVVVAQVALAVLVKLLFMKERLYNNVLLCLY